MEGEGVEPRSPATTAHSKRLLRRRIVLSYLVDFVVIGILFIPSVLAPWIKPYQRPIDLEDPSIAYPYSTSEIFPNWSLPLICFGVPVLLIVGRMAVEKFRRPELVLAIIGALFSIALTDFITNVTKNLVGRLRPDFLARCIPELNSAGVVICKQVRKSFVEEGRRSFPSGHASTSFAGLSFVALFLAGQLRLYDRQGMALKMTLSFCPIFLALGVSISRVLDYRHHWVDVAIGGLLGLVITAIVYPMYFPSIFSAESDQIYTTRIDRIRADIEAAARTEMPNNPCPEPV